MEITVATGGQNHVSDPRIAPVLLGIKGFNYYTYEKKVLYTEHKLITILNLSPLMGPCLNMFNLLLGLIHMFSIFVFPAKTWHVHFNLSLSLHTIHNLSL